MVGSFQEFRSQIHRMLAAPLLSSVLVSWMRRCYDALFPAFDLCTLSLAFSKSGKSGATSRGNSSSLH